MKQTPDAVTPCAATLVALGGSCSVDAHLIVLPEENMTGSEENMGDIDKRVGITPMDNTSKGSQKPRTEEVRYREVQ